MSDALGDYRNFELCARPFFVCVNTIKETLFTRPEDTGRELI
jgi:hypothetical protein